MESGPYLMAMLLVVVYCANIMAFGYVISPNLCSALEVELWEMATGLEIAWGMDFKQLIVKADSMDAIKVLQNRLHKNNLIALINYVKEFYSQNCRVSIAVFL
ncbi:hypothetical protein V6N13_046583 [Hibiscus sabdariffa]|uniref:Uncharacterized protein n=2 Tax=Hibiscus sabdariffa TaxID=183260 RepID=A0ABR2NZM7_9ROSI